MRRIEIDPSNLADLVKRHASGEPLKLLGTRHGVSDVVVRRWLREARVTRTGKNRATAAAGHEASIADAYRAGASELALAAQYRVARSMIARILREQGVPRRDCHNAQLTRWEGSTRAARRAVTAKANAAMRGRPLTWEKRLKDAAGRERTGSLASPLDRRVAAELTRRGLSVGVQTAVGPYNCDLTVASGSVAVEVFGGGWHWSGDHAARHRKRSRYILDQGWHLICLVVDHRRPLTVDGYDYLVAFCEFAERNPTAAREYRVVGGTGQPLPGLRPDLDPRA